MSQAKKKKCMAKSLGQSFKASNPKDALSGGKARWFSYIPLRVLVGVGLAMYEGARKYGRHNYRAIGVRASVYVDAAVCGHLTRWMEGEDIDAESGLNHIDKAIASLMVLRDAIYQGNLIDDRPPIVTDIAVIMEDANASVREMIARHPKAAPAYTK